MDRRILLVATVFVLMIAGFSGVGAADSVPENGTVSNAETLEGVSVELDAELESAALTNMETIASRNGLSTREHAFQFIHNGETYFVYTDTEPATGSARVRGAVVIEATEDSPGTIFADSVRFETEGEPVDLNSIRENPSGYNNEHVRVTGSLRQLSFTTDVESQLVTQSSAGLIGGENHALQRITASPGQQARWSVLNMSGSEFGLDRTEAMFLELSGPSNGVLTYSSNTRFWMDSEVRMDAVVSSSENGAVLRVADVTPVANDISGPGEIQQRGDDLSDEVVRFDTQVVGSTTSSQEFLTTVAPCGTGDNVLVPAGPTCVPVVTDTTLHSGVLFTGTPQSRDDVVPYAGLSNHHQDVVTQAETGTYEVTGRVVAGGEIDPSLAGEHALVVYDMERQGDLQVRGAARDEAEAQASVVTGQMEEQMNSSQQEWSQSRSESRNDASGDESDSEDSSSGEDSNENQQDNGENVILVSADLVDENSLRNDRYVRVNITVRNTASSTSNREFVLHTESGEFLASQFTHLEPGEEAQFTINYWPEPPIHQELYLNGTHIGTLRIDEDPLESDDSVLSGFSGMSNELGFLLSGTGGILLISGFVLGLMRQVKMYKGASQLAVSARDNKLVYGLGLIGLALGGLLLGGEFIFITLFSGALTLLWLLVEGFQNAYSQL